MKEQSAFPIPNDPSPGSYPAEPGMSLRQYYAAKAMQALISTFGTPMGNQILVNMMDQGKTAANGLSEIAFTYADAMVSFELPSSPQPSESAHQPAP